jgi:hypothetical protein
MAQPWMFMMMIIIIIIINDCKLYFILSLVLYVVHYHPEVADCFDL